MIKNVAILFIVCSFASCASVFNTSGAKEEVIITYRKTTCMGKCPAYYLEIFDNGKVVFEGVQNIEYIGTYNSQISKKELNELVSRFIDSDFFEFEDEYTARITDLPSTYIGFSYKGKTKQIRDYYGSPKELKELESLIDDIVKRNGWLKGKVE